MRAVLMDMTSVGCRRRLQLLGVVSTVVVVKDALHSTEARRRNAGSDALEALWVKETHVSHWMILPPSADFWWILPLLPTGSIDESHLVTT